MLFLTVSMFLFVVPSIVADPEIISDAIIITEVGDNLEVECHSNNKVMWDFSNIISDMDIAMDIPDANRFMMTFDNNKTSAYFKIKNVSLSDAKYIFCLEGFKIIKTVELVVYDEIKFISVFYGDLMFLGYTICYMAPNIIISRDNLFTYYRWVEIVFVYNGINVYHEGYFAGGVYNGKCVVARRIDSIDDLDLTSVNMTTNISTITFVYKLKVFKSYIKLKQLPVNNPNLIILTADKQEQKIQYHDENTTALMREYYEEINTIMKMKLQSNTLKDNEIKPRMPLILEYMNNFMSEKASVEQPVIYSYKDELINVSVVTGLVIFVQAVIIFCLLYGRYRKRGHHAIIKAKAVKDRTDRTTSIYRRGAASRSDTEMSFISGGGDTPEQDKPVITTGTQFSNSGGITVAEIH